MKTLTLTFYLIRESLSWTTHFLHEWLPLLLCVQLVHPCQVVRQLGIRFVADCTLPSGSLVQAVEKKLLDGGGQHQRAQIIIYMISEAIITAAF